MVFCLCEYLDGISSDASDDTAKEDAQTDKSILQILCMYLLPHITLRFHSNVPFHSGHSPFGRLCRENSFKGKEYNSARYLLYMIVYHGVTHLVRVCRRGFKKG
jgi:hypothetical protein